MASIDGAYLLLFAQTVFWSDAVASVEPPCRSACVTYLAETAW